MENNTDLPSWNLSFIIIKSQIDEKSLTNLSDSQKSVNNGASHTRNSIRSSSSGDKSASEPRNASSKTNNSEQKSSSSNRIESGQKSNSSLGNGSEQKSSSGKKRKRVLKMSTGGEYDTFSLWSKFPEK